MGAVFAMAQVIVLPTHAHQVIFALYMDAHDGTIIMVAQSHPYETYHVLNVVAHNIPL